MIEDMGRSSDGTEIKSMYPLCKCNLPHSRKVRDLGSFSNRPEITDPVPPAPDIVSEESSGEVPNSSEAPLLRLVDAPDPDLTKDYLIPMERDEPKGKNKREKVPVAAELRLRDDANQKLRQNSINVMSSPQALIQDASALFHNHFDLNETDNKVPQIYVEESVIDPPILLPKSSEVTDNIYKYPEYEQVDKHYTPDSITDTEASVDFPTESITEFDETVENASSLEITIASVDYVSNTSDSQENHTSSTHSTSSVHETTTILYSNELSTVSTYSTEKFTDSISETDDEATSEIVTVAVPTVSVDIETTYTPTTTELLTLGKSIFGKEYTSMLGFGSYASLDYRLV